MEELRIALATSAFQRGEFRIADSDLEGFTHIVTSRDGLFAVRPGAFKQIAYGYFFGSTLSTDHIDLFEANARPYNGVAEGRLIRVGREGSRLTGAVLLSKGLSGGCHQIDFFDDALHVVDTYNQAVLRYHNFDQTPQYLRPLPQASRDEWAAGYVHANSILRVRDGILLLLHNGGTKIGQPSVLLLLNAHWQEIDRVILPAMGAHNIAVRPDGRVLVCASETGEVIALDGERIAITSMMTRGLSVSDDIIAVGASEYARRQSREKARGSVYFFDSDFRPVATVDLPAAPTDIRRLDGRDDTLSATTRQYSARLR